MVGSSSSGGGVLPCSTVMLIPQSGFRVQVSRSRALSLLLVVLVVFFRSMTVGGMGFIPERLLMMMMMMISSIFSIVCYVFLLLLYPSPLPCSGRNCRTAHVQEHAICRVICYCLILI